MVVVVPGWRGGEPRGGRGGRVVVGGGGRDTGEGAGGRVSGHLMAGWLDAGDLLPTSTTLLPYSRGSDNTKHKVIIICILFW